MGSIDETLEVSSRAEVRADAVEIAGPVAVVSARGVYLYLVSASLNKGRELNVLATMGVIQMASKPIPWM